MREIKRESVDMTTVCFRRAIVYRTQGAFSLSLQANVTRYRPLQDQIISVT